ncbi:MAG TPA: dihydroneopterin aldolase [Geobacteraceae bacterium]|nr:dihydroneopterin aldolase [Geobacteraceae bacterium]
MSDEIRIEDLLVRTVIGINGEERRDRQDVLINLVLFVDTRAAGLTDDIAATPVNFRTLTKRVIGRVEESQFHLIERLAQEIADLCLEEPGVERVRVEVTKPGALRFARSVSIVIERGRSDG